MNQDLELELVLAKTEGQLGLSEMLFFGWLFFQRMKGMFE